MTDDPDARDADDSDATAPDELLVNDTSPGGRSTHHVFRRGAVENATGPLGEVARPVPAFCSRGSLGPFLAFDPDDGLPDDVDADVVCKDCAQRVRKSYGLELLADQGPDHD